MWTIAGGIILAFLILAFAEILIPLAIIAGVLYLAFWAVIYGLALISIIFH